MKLDHDPVTPFEIERELLSLYAQWREFLGTSGRHEKDDFASFAAGFRQGFSQGTCATAGKENAPVERSARKADQPGFEGAGMSETSEIKASVDAWHEHADARQLPREHSKRHEFFAGWWAAFRYAKALPAWQPPLERCTYCNLQVYKP